MERRTYWTLAALVVSTAVGCSSSSAPAPTSTAVSAIPADPAARAAYDFLDAVLKGDTLRASKRLTPIAIERINATGKQFSPPGLQTASFRIGEVRKPTADQALVQCVLTDSSQGAPRTEEIGCLLRLVDNDWRVSGIAYIPGPNRPPMILNFENPQQGAVSAQPPMASAGDPAANVDRPSPSSPSSTPRTAEQAVTPASYR
ncbi:MAG TPA: hypothetical protein VGJ04_03640 [Pirellulales bacterium]|jgi:hypothetical protein